MMASAMLKQMTSGTPQQPAGTYSPDILPLLQSLLSTLADIDFRFQKDRETILSSTTDELLKQRAIAPLKRYHQERRAPYLREIERLERRIQETFD
jgi:hypothetical protein